MKDAARAERFRAVKLILSDVDGVLTDGRILLLDGGGEAVSFHVRDGLAFVLARRAGLRTGILSGRSSSVVRRRAEELGLDVIEQGAGDKRATLAAILEREGLRAHEVAYIGDDVSDLPVLLEAGVSAAPADAPFEVRTQAFMVTEAPGGGGCLREFVEALLRERGDWDRLVSPH